MGVVNAAASGQQTVRAKQEVRPPRLRLVTWLSRLRPRLRDSSTRDSRAVASVSRHDLPSSVHSTAERTSAMWTWVNPSLRSSLARTVATPALVPGNSMVCDEPLISCSMT